MSETVYSLDEAQSWFLENHSGSVTCSKEGKSKEVNSYPEAKTFFESSED